MTGDVWEVLFDEPNDRTIQNSDRQTITLVCRDEASARSVLADTRQKARALTYTNIYLRHNGEIVDETPHP